MNSQNYNCLCMKCKNLLINHRVWDKDDSIRKYCGILFPITNLEELKDKKTCDYFSEISNPSRKILILGASGLIGGSLYREFSCYNRFKLTGTYNFNRFPKDLLQLDLENTMETIELINDLTPDVLIWAAENQYSKENSNIRNTFIEIIKNIPSKTKFVFFSSDTVFSGKYGNYKEADEVDIPSNDNYLHDSILVKIERERFVKTLPDSIIIRTGPVYGKYLSGRWDFRTDTILSDIEHGSFTTITENTVRSFINCRFLAKSVIRLIEKDFKGIIHITNSTKRSTFEHYRILAEYNGYNINLIRNGNEEPSEDLSLDNSFFKSIDKDLKKIY